jgi:hypothetical protein
LPPRSTPIRAASSTARTWRPRAPSCAPTARTWR